MNNLIYIILFFSIHFTDKNIEKHSKAEINNVTDTLIVMSYNIKYGSPLGSSIPNLDAIANVILDSKADIVFLQEVDKNTTRSGEKDQLAILAGETDLQSYYYGRAIDYQGGQTGIGILSRYPLSDPKIFKLPRIELGERYVSYRVLTTANIMVKDQEITIANTHLALTPENRALQVPKIIEILSESGNPIVLGGDFNAKPESPTIQTFLECGFRKTCKLDCYTIPSTDPNRELDYIMFRPANKMEVLSHKVVPDHSSDHLPILSVLKIQR